MPVLRRMFLIGVTSPTLANRLILSYPWSRSFVESHSITVVWLLRWYLLQSVAKSIPLNRLSLRVHDLFGNFKFLVSRMPLDQTENRTQPPPVWYCFVVAPLPPLPSALSSIFIIAFVWVAFHCSIVGNERADSVANVNDFFNPIFRQQSLGSWQYK